VHQPNGYIGTTEAARILKVAPRTVDRWVAKGLIRPAFRTDGGYARYELAAVLALAESQRVAS
jgi:DNA-binding transcriptional MerR regulator